MKKFFLFIGLLLFFPFIASALPSKGKRKNSFGFYEITGNDKMRNDQKGKGHFKASRGSKKHNGIDLLVEKNQFVKAPFNGEITRIFTVYANDSKYKGFEIVGSAENSNMKIKIMYANPILNNGSFFYGGDNIGIAQSISEKYGSEMKDHLHIEVYKNDILENPDIYFID